MPKAGRIWKRTIEPVRALWRAVRKDVTIEFEPVRALWRAVREHVTLERVKAAGIVFTAATFGVGCWQFWHQWQEERLQRALTLIERASIEPQPAQHRELAKTDAEETAARWRDIDARRAMFVYFPDRFQGAPVPLPVLGSDEARSLRDISLKPKFGPEDYELYQKWDTARRHLNDLEVFAFAYVYDFADRKLLAASSCGQLVRSNAYFRNLIAAFKEKYGSAQSWQIIPKAVEQMEGKFGPGCEKLFATAGRSAASER